jgi:hypothetical protein
MYPKRFIPLNALDQPIKLALRVAVPICRPHSTNLPVQNLKDVLSEPIPIARRLRRVIVSAVCRFRWRSSISPE